MPDFSKARYTHIYPTPLLTYVLKDGLEFNASLRKQILAHRAKTSGVSKSNHGGWHSETGQLEFCGGAGQRLVRHMYEMADEATKRVLAEFGEEFQPVKWRLEAWANVNASGDFNKMHVHPASTWSGTYYVDPGEPADAKGGTPLHLFDPCSGRTTFLPSLPATIYIYPKPALMVLFPSYVPHMVFPHDGASERISIAFNLRKEPFP